MFVWEGVDLSRTDAPETEACPTCHPKKKKTPHKHKSNKTTGAKLSWQTDPKADEAVRHKQVQPHGCSWRLRMNRNSSFQTSDGTLKSKVLRNWLTLVLSLSHMSLPEKEKKRRSLGILAKFSQLNGEIYESQTDDKKYRFFLMVKINNPPFVLVLCYRLIVIATILSALLILQCIPWVQCDWISLGVLMELTGRRGASYSTVLPFSK